MSRRGLAILAALTLGSIWLGFEVDPRRDYLAWLFLVVVPVAIVALAAYLIVRKKEKSQ